MPLAIKDDYDSDPFNLGRYPVVMEVSPIYTPTLQSFPHQNKRGSEKV